MRIVLEIYIHATLKKVTPTRDMMGVNVYTVVAARSGR